MKLTDRIKKRTLFPEKKGLEDWERYQIPEYGSGIVKQNFIYSEIYLNLITIWLMGERLNSTLMLFICICQILYNICDMGTESIHAFDYQRKYNFGTFLVFRFRTILLVFLGGWIILLFSGYANKSYYTILFFLILIGRSMESFARCCEAEFVRLNKTVHSEPVRVYRQVVSLIAYTIVLIFARDILLAYAVTILVKTIFILIFDFYAINHKKKVYWHYQEGKFGEIVKISFPDFLPNLSCSILLYWSRLILGFCFPGSELSCYQECFILAQFFFQLLYILIKPYLMRITKLWGDGKYEICKKTIMSFSAGIGAITILSVILLSVAGPELLDLLFSDNFKGSRQILYWLAAALGIRILNIELYFVLVLWNARNLASFLRFICAIGVIIASVIFIPSYGIFAAVIIYALGRAAEYILLSLSAVCLYFFKKNKVQVV